MKIMSYELELGISINKRNLHLVEGYSRAGITACEIGMRKDSNEPRNLTKIMPFVEEAKKKVLEAGLKIYSIHLPYGKLWDISDTDEEQRAIVVQNYLWCIEQVKDWGVRIMVLHPSPEPIDPEMRELKLQACERSIEEIVRFASKTGIQIVLEDLPRTCLGNNSSEMSRLTRHGSLLGTCLDTTHLFQETTLQYLDSMAETVKHTHFSDYDGTNECHWIPGRGVVPWAQVIHRLMKVGYNGILLFELADKQEGIPYTGQEIVSSFIQAVERTSMDILPCKE